MVLTQHSDTFEATLEAFRKASRKSDFILTSGGMSVGEADFIRRAVEELGKMQMWRIAMKPGKPVAKGEVRGVPFIGLPGNPGLRLCDLPAVCSAADS